MKSNNPTAGKKSSKPAESAARMVELWAAPGIVALSTFLVFLAALDNGFVDWDDDKTITENPHFRGLGWNQLGLGVLLARQGMREAALPYLRKAAASSPGDSQIRYDLAVVLATTSEPEEAVEHFSATVRLKPDHPQAHYNLGVVLASQGQLQDAMRHFRETLTIDANYTKAHHQLAVLLNEQGNTGEAVGHLRRALELEPEFAEAHGEPGPAAGTSGQKG